MQNVSIMGSQHASLQASRLLALRNPGCWLRTFNKTMLSDFSHVNKPSCLSPGIRAAAHETSRLEAACFQWPTDSALTTFAPWPASRFIWAS